MYLHEHHLFASGFYFISHFVCSDNFQISFFLFYWTNVKYMFSVICSIEGLNQTQKPLGKQRWGEGRGRGRGARGRGAQSPSKGPVKSLYSRDRVPTYRRSRSVSSDSSSRSRSRSPRRKKDRKDRSSRRRHSRYNLLLIQHCISLYHCFTSKKTRSILLVWLQQWQQFFNKFKRYVILHEFERFYE